MSDGSRTFARSERARSGKTGQPVFNEILGFPRRASQESFSLARMLRTRDGSLIRGDYQSLAGTSPPAGVTAPQNPASEMLGDRERTLPSIQATSSPELWGV